MRPICHALGVDNNFFSSQSVSSRCYEITGKFNKIEPAEIDIKTNTVTGIT